MSTRAVSTAIRKSKTYLAQLYINRDQQSERIPELYITRNQKLTRNHFWTTYPCRPVRYIDRYQQSKSISGAAVYHQRGIAVYQQQSKTEAKARLDDTAVSTRAVYQPRELFIDSNRKRKRNHFCLTQPYRPGRCINREQQSKSISGAAVYHQRGIAVYFWGHCCQWLGVARASDTPVPLRPLSFRSV